MAVTSRHNKYTSIPDWFSGQSTETATTGSSVSQTVYISGSSGSTTTDSTVDFKDIPIDASTIVWQNELLTVPIDNDKIIIVDGKLTTSLNSDSVWELRLLADGTNYIYTTYPVVTQLGITMYSGTEGLDIGGIYDGLPIDNTTIYWDIDSNGNKVLKAIGSSSGGGVADSVTWANVVGKPMWLLDDKISYSEIEGTPDLSKYALVSLIPSLEGYALSSDLAKYIPISGYTDITGEKNFTGGLKVNGSPIYYDTEKKYWKLEGDLLVTGGVTMYGNDSDFVASTIMDAILYDDTTLGINANGELYVKGGTGGGGISSVTSQMIVDALGYTPASATALSGYLPLSGGTLINTLTIDNSNVGLILHRSGQATPYIRFGQDTNNEWGELGVYNDGRLVFWPLVSSQGGYGKWNTLWHEGNDGSGSGLDADLLDGKHYSDIINGNVASATRLQAYQHNSGENILISGTRTDNTFPRYIYDNSWGLCLRWQEGNGVVHNGIIATLNDNVASATKLATARTIWGQSFDGTGNVDGDLIGSRFSGTLFASGFNDTWSDGTNSHVWYGYDHRYPNTGVYSTTITDYFGLTLKTASGNISMTQDGNVGIGTTNPSRSLVISNNGAEGIEFEWHDANGSILTYNRKTATYLPCTIVASVVNIGNSGKSCNLLVTGGVTMYSARKLKTIQDERGLSLEELSVIKPTRFTWKDGRDDKVHIGGIADDVQKVLPEVIYKAGEDDTLTMDYGNAAFAIAASLIKPVVNHEERIRLLEEENKRLKEEVEQLKWNIA